MSFVCEPPYAIQNHVLKCVITWCDNGVDAESSRDIAGPHRQCIMRLRKLCGFGFGTPRTKLETPGPAPSLVCLGGTVHSFFGLFDIILHASGFGALGSVTLKGLWIFRASLRDIGRTLGGNACRNTQL